MTSYIQPRHGNLTSIEPRAKVKKTYAQWKAYPHFKHCIEFPSEYNVVSCFDYYSVFKWCYEILGEGIDLRTWIVLNKNTMGIEVEDIHKHKWCFQTADNMHKNRIYLKSDKELSVFSLKWL